MCPPCARADERAAIAADLREVAGRQSEPTASILRAFADYLETRA